MTTIMKKIKTRLIVQRGTENFALRMEELALFYTENKIVFVIDSLEKKYICDKNLSELESELNENIFFRANRQYIINVNYIRGFRMFEKVKLQVDLNVADTSHFIIISQNTAPCFRKWIAQEL